MEVLGVVFWPRRSRSHDCEWQQTRNPQCQGQAFLLVFGKQNASLQQLLSHMATVMMMIIEEGEEAASERGGGKGEEATSEDIYKKLRHVKTFTDI